MALFCFIDHTYFEIFFLSFFGNDSKHVFFYQKLSLFATWKGYRSSKEKPAFRVRKLMGIRMFLGFLRGYSFCKAVIKLDEDMFCEYKMENQSSKQSCRIVDNYGGLVAEVSFNVI